MSPRRTRMTSPPWLALSGALLALMLGGCATTTTTASAEAVQQAAVTPLNDLNVVRAEIPPALQAALKAPYAVPVDRSCTGVSTEVQALDAALGADLDVPPSATAPSLIERGASEAFRSATDALRDAAASVVPYRNWVRRLTGAERYSREVAAAIAAGTVRRAYLKGVGQSLGCTPPAAPVLAPPLPPASAPLK